LAATSPEKVTSPGIAAEVLGVSLGSSLEELRSAFRRRARDAHPDGGGSSEAFRILREAYSLLRRGRNSADSSAVEDSTGKAQAQRRAWDRWEADVTAFLELPDEGDVIYWRVEQFAPWQPAVVLARQVVHEPASGPHGWIYMQPLVEEAPGGALYMDEEADMDQVEPLSPDGVNWCFAPEVERVVLEGQPGRWNLGPPPPSWV